MLGQTSRPDRPEAVRRVHAVGPLRGGGWLRSEASRCAVLRDVEPLSVLGCRRRVSGWLCQAGDARGSGRRRAIRSAATAASRAGRPPPLACARQRNTEVDVADLEDPPLGCAPAPERSDPSSGLPGPITVLVELDPFRGAPSLRARCVWMGRRAPYPCARWTRPSYANERSSSRPICGPTRPRRQVLGRPERVEGTGARHPVRGRTSPRGWSRCTHRGRGRRRRRARRGRGGWAACRRCRAGCATWAATEGPAR